VVSPGFSLDVERLRSAFDRVDAIVWQAHRYGPHDDSGPCLAIEGSFQGQEVWLQVLEQAPKDDEPGTKFNRKKRDRRSDRDC